MFSPQDVEEKEKENKLPLQEVNCVVGVCAESISIGIYEMAVHMSGRSWRR